MNRLLLRVLVLTITFICGFGVDFLVSRRWVKRAAKVESIELVTPTVTEPKYVQVVQAATAPTPAPNLILDFDEKQFLPDGGYYIIGPVPTALQEFRSLELYSGFHDEPPMGYIGVDIYLDGRHQAGPAVFALVTERRLFFVTSSTTEGNEYRFDGEFLRKDVGSGADQNISVLRGKLTKTKKGRKLVERLVNFRFEYTGC